MMLCGMEFETDDTADTFWAGFLSLSGLGATREVVDMTSNDNAGGWGEIQLSCIARMKNLRIELLLKENLDWKSKITEALKSLKLKFPPPKGFDTGIIVEFECGAVDVEIGGSFNGRTIVTIVMAVNGEPTITAADEEAGP